MKVLLLVPYLLALEIAEGGYYKIRPPPPPPIPPASIHYGPHPPLPHHHHSSKSSYIHPHRSPPQPPPHLSHYVPHAPAAHSYHPARVQHVHKTSPREYHRFPPYHPPPKINNFHQWKHFNSFRAPVIKETFNPPPTVSYHTPTYIKDEDKGPIHTIPAPNLGPSDKPNLYQNDFGLHHKKQDAEADLVAVLNHGIHHVNVPHLPGYQVTEDPSLHTPHSDVPAYFAPDPDPNVPTVKVPTTTDPHSLPSNGQVPLDLYLQQEAEKAETALKQTAAHHSAAASVTNSDNKLTAQDLFNLLNYQPGGAVNLIPQTQLQQHILQPNVQFYNQGLLVPQYQPALQKQPQIQQQHQQFQPQFQTFNYDERTQQGAYGSNNFPSTSMSIDINTNAGVVNGHNDIYDPLLDNSVAGSEREEVFNNEIIHPQFASDKKISENRDEKSISKPQTVSSSVMYSTKSSQQKEDTTTPTSFEEAANSRQAEESAQTESETKNMATDNKQEESEVKNLKDDDNVQLQKSIQIYEYSSHSDDSDNKGELKDIYNYKNEEEKTKKTGRGIVIGEVVSDSVSSPSETDPITAEIPFGARIRPKRY